jgi:hypothetical protein
MAQINPKTIRKKAMARTRQTVTLVVPIVMVDSNGDGIVCFDIGSLSFFHQTLRYPYFCSFQPPFD